MAQTNVYRGGGGAAVDLFGELAEKTE